MATPSQRRRQSERDYERETIRQRLNIGEDIQSLRTLRALQSLANRIGKLELEKSQVKD